MELKFLKKTGLGGRRTTASCRIYWNLSLLWTLITQHCQINVIHKGHSSEHFCKMIKDFECYEKRNQQYYLKFWHWTLWKLHHACLNMHLWNMKIWAMTNRNWGIEWCHEEAEQRQESSKIRKFHHQIGNLRANQQSHDKHTLIVVTVTIEIFKIATWEKL